MLCRGMDHDNPVPCFPIRWSCMAFSPGASGSPAVQQSVLLGLIHIHCRVIGCVVVVMNMGDLLRIHDVSFALDNSSITA